MFRVGNVRSNVNDVILGSDGFWVSLVFIIDVFLFKFYCCVLGIVVWGVGSIKKLGIWKLNFVYLY